jgi:hypothetical protein
MLTFVGIICGPILLFWTSIRGDLEAMRNFPFLFSPGFQVLYFHQKVHLKVLKCMLDKYIGKIF